MPIIGPQRKLKRTCESQCMSILRVSGGEILERPLEMVLVVVHGMDSDGKEFPLEFYETNRKSILRGHEREIFGYLLGVESCHMYKDAKLSKDPKSCLSHNRGK
jgi:hypothetical protein